MLFLYFRRRIGKFAREERAQGGIEYVLIVSGIIAAAVVVLSIYPGMAGSTATTLDESAVTKISEIDSTINSPP